jgi:hypothetical protein
MKLTKRKGFNFYRGYFDVYNELPQEDRLAFIDALLNKQFMGVNPKDLKGLVKFAYISQLNSIDSQVKGYEDKTKTRLNGTPYTRGNSTPTEGGTQGGASTPTLQEKEKEKEKEKEQDVYSKFDFLDDWNSLRAKHLNKPSNLNSLNFQDEQMLRSLYIDNSREDFKNAMVGLFKQKKLPNGNTTMQSNPSHLLKFFNSYLTAFHDVNDMLYGKKEE